MRQEQCEEQLASRMAEAEREREAAGAAAAAPSTEEKRIDPSDGRAVSGRILLGGRPAGWALLAG